MNILEANKEIERIDNELEFWINKKAFILESTIYPKSGTGDRVQGGKREDKYKHLDYAIDEIDPQIEKLYKEKKMYEDYIDKELLRLGKYREVEQLIIYYKEQCIDQYTWFQISQRVHYSESQCRKIYRRWKKQREIE